MDSTWFRGKKPSIPEYKEFKDILTKNKCDTLCEDIYCPNISSCWSRRSINILLLGTTYTRAPRFFPFKQAETDEDLKLDPNEPTTVANIVKDAKLEYVILCCATRDDLDDGGLSHIVSTIEQIKTAIPTCKIEVMIPDFNKESLAVLIDAKPHIITHNIDTVPRLYKYIKPACDYSRSIVVLKNLYELAPNVIVKSGIMVGLGERDEEIYETMADLRQVKVNICTIGQYLQPNDHCIEVERQVSAQLFKDYENVANHAGFSIVESGQSVRSCYKIWRAFPDK